MGTAEVVDLLERIDRALRADGRAIAAAHGLVPAQLDALRYLTRCNRWSDTPAAVAEFLDTTPGTASQTVTALERKGLVHKVADPTDRRRWHCVPTDAGRALVAATRGAQPSLAPEVADALRAGLTDLLRSIQRSRAGRSFGTCATCAHLRRDDAGTWCGLTHERLTEDDTARVCREHSPRPD
ncbi:MAG: MarR family winged helix-turn-helix transcriptional regulator [Myxococcota bacterium]